MTATGPHPPAPPDVEGTLFDVAIVGSGFGGGTMAYALSRAGLNVLLIERGGWAHRDETDWNGRAILLDGRYRGDSPIDVDQRAEGPAARAFPNEAVGGNSIFFGGAALRLRESDFGRWPIGYRDLERHYTAAEQLLEIHGHAGTDPVEPKRSSPYPFAPPPLTAPARRIFAAAEKLGWHPFQIPVAINHAGPREPKCINCFTCDGFPCRIGAKNDIAQTALAKADPARLAILARTIASPPDHARRARRGPARHRPRQRTASDGAGQALRRLRRARWRRRRCCCGRAWTRWTPRARWAAI